MTPRGGRNAVIGYRAADNTLLLRVQSPPVDGAANKAVIALVAELFGVRKSAVALVSGETGREKRLALADITQEQIQEKLHTFPQA